MEDNYFQDHGVALSPRDWAALRYTDNRYSYMRDPPTLDRPMVRDRAECIPSPCNNVKILRPNSSDYLYPYPYQILRSDYPYLMPWIQQPGCMDGRMRHGGMGNDPLCMNSYNLLLLVILFIVVAIVAFSLGCSFSHSLRQPSPSGQPAGIGT